MGEKRALSDIVREHIDNGDAELPVFDETAGKIQQMAASGAFDVDAIEELIAGDPALCSAVLRSANSSFFRGIDKVVTVGEAIMRLGVKQISELVMIASQQQQYRIQEPSLHKISLDLWRHSVGCAVGSQWLAKSLELEKRAEEAFLAGLLHDVGKLLVLRVLDDLVAAKRIAVPTLDLVHKLIDALHCEYGGLLLDSWNVPETYQTIVEKHHDERVEGVDELLLIVRLVDIACNALGLGLREPSGVNVAASVEAQALKASEVKLAELEIRLEDAMELAR